MKSNVLAIAAIVCLLCSSTAEAQWPTHTYGNKGQWEVEIGTRILDRPSDFGNISLVTSVPTNAVVFTGADATDLDTSPGVDFRFLKQTNYDGSWELRGSFNRWENLETRSGNLRAPLFTPVTLPLGSRPDRFDYHYQSELFSLELNYRRAVHPGLSFFYGPRWVSLEEEVNIDSNFINPFIPGFAFDLDSSTTVDNQMPGLGFGLELRRPVCRDVFFTTTVKGAVLANFVSTNTQTTGTVIGGTPVNTLIFEDSQTDLAGIGELGARIHYDVVPGNISWYLGYEAVWLDGVALAPAQLLANFAPPVQLDTSTTTVAHGVVTGLMVRY